MLVPAQENLKNESKMHPNLKAELAPIRHFWSAD